MRFTMKQSNGGDTKLFNLMGHLLKFIVVQLLVLPVFAFAQQEGNAIESILANQEGSNVVVRVNLKNPLSSNPTNFSVTNPARIAFDFPNTANGIGKNQLDIAQGDLNSVHIVQTENRARLVFNLRKSLTYKTSIEGNQLVITLDGVTNSAIGSRPNRNAEQTINPAQAIKDVDFRRGKDGEGRVVIELPHNQMGVDIRQQGQTIVADFLRARLPDTLRRRMDVADFSTPVAAISTFPQGDSVRMVIEPQGLWEYNAYQSDTQFVVEVRAIKEDPNKLVQGSGTGYKGERLSLNFQNVEVRALLQVIADFTNFNVVTSDTVSGNLTLRLKDVPWDQALDIIMQAKGLDYRKNGNVLWVAPKDELMTKEKLELEAKAQVANLEPVRNQVYQLNYQKAQDVRAILLGAVGGTSNNTNRITSSSINSNSAASPVGMSGGQAYRLLSDRGSVAADIRTNQLFVTDIGVKLEEVAKLIQRIDIPVRQVLIEARVVEADDKFSRNLGAKLGFADLRTIRGGTSGVNLTGNTNATITGNYVGVGQQTGQAALDQNIYAPNTQFVSLPASGINGFNAGSVAVSLFSSAANRFLNLELSALEAEGRGKIISSPRVVTSDKTKAIIEQGTELPYQVATSSGATAIVFRKANLKLEVIPQITPEGNVIMEVDVNKDSVGQQTTAGFAIDTKHVQTEVLVENGGTIVIGGIYIQTERNTTNKVPFFGDIPILGHLFKENEKVNDKTELLIFLTPKVVSDKIAAR